MLRTSVSKVGFNTSIYVDERKTKVFEQATHMK